MKLDLSHAQQSTTHPGRLEFDLIEVFRRDPRGTAWGLRHGFVNGQRRTLTLNLDGTQLWLEMWPALPDHNEPRVLLPVGVEVEVPSFALDRQTQKAIRIVAVRESNQANGGRALQLNDNLRLELSPVAESSFDDPEHDAALTLEISLAWQTLA